MISLQSLCPQIVEVLAKHFLQHKKNQRSNKGNYNSYEEDAINIANETIYGLSGYVSSENIENAKEVASKLRTGMVHINNAPGDQAAPFGGYKMSGNGREWGEFGLEDFLEIKSVMGAIPKSA